MRRKGPPIDARVLIHAICFTAAMLEVPAWAADGPIGGVAEVHASRPAEGARQWYDRFSFRPLGVVGYWPLDDDARDRSGNGNDGVWQPGGYHTTGILRNGYQMYPGVYYTVPNSSTLQSTFHEITMAAWFKADAIAYDNEALLGMGADDRLDPRFYLFVTGSFDTANVPGVMVLAINDDGERVDTPTVVPIPDFIGTWHHLAATFDGASTRIYVDGELRSERRDVRGTFTMRAPFYMNRHDWWTWDSRLTGVIDEPVVLNRALSANAIRALAHDDDGNGIADFWQEAGYVSTLNVVDTTLHERLVTH